MAPHYPKAVGFSQARTLTRPTVRLLLRARRVLTITAGLALLRLRQSSDAGRALAALVHELRLTVSRLEAENRYLRDRLARIPPRHSSHYTPTERFQILVFMQTHALSIHEAAARFLVTRTTLARWRDEATSAPARDAIGTLLRATPPIRRYADVVRDLVQAMEAWGFGGSRRIAQTLARAGVRPGSSGFDSATAGRNTAQAILRGLVSRFAPGDSADGDS